MPAEQADPRISVTVPVPPAEAFRIYTECPTEWVPPGHALIKDSESLIVIEPRVGGRFYERGADGTEAIRGTLVEWAPPTRLAVTWRIGPNWQPIDNDEHASVVVVEFKPVDPEATEVTLTYTHLERHGENMAKMIRVAISTPGPDNTLEKYAEVVARHAANA
jgi:uncharacterized protein YndB with AHSA1/START domain